MKIAVSLEGERYMRDGLDDEIDKSCCVVRSTFVDE